MVKKLLQGIKHLGYKILKLGNYYYGYTYLFKQEHNTAALAPGYTVTFDNDEQLFLEKSAACFGFASDDYTYGYRQKALALSELKNIKLFSNTGVVVLQDKLLAESAFSVGRLASSTSYRDFTLLFPKNLPDNTYTSIIHGHWADNNIFHWYIDCLPRLYTLVHALKIPVKLLMWKDAPKYQQESLTFLLKGNQNFEIVAVNRRTKFKVEKYVLPHFVSNSMSGYLPKNVSGWMREKIWLGYNIQKGGPKRRIYISRSNAKTRRVLNEQDLLPILTKHGFKVVRPEELSYQQQVQLFFDAEAVVAPHGAGLTNLLFAERCQVLELHPANLIKTHYFLLCKGLDFEYSAVMGSVGDRLENYSVDVREVEAWLTATLK